VGSSELADNAVDTAAIADDAVTNAKIADSQINNAKIGASAAIAGTKISPDFGSQNIVTTGNVGIGSGSGTSTPLHVVGSGNTTVLKVESTDADENVGPIIELFRNSGSPADNDAIGRLDFKADDDAGNPNTFARIAAVATDVSNGSEDARIDFTAVTNDTFTPTMSLTGQNVGIGTTTPATLLHLSGGGNTTLSINTGNDSGDNSTINFGDSADGNPGFINYDHGTNAMQIRVNASERMRIDSYGNVGIGSSTINLQSNPNRKILNLNGPTNAAVVLNRSDTITGFLYGASDEFRIQGAAGAGNLVRIRNDNGTIAQFDDNGLKFNGDTAAANGLDDYEEGDITLTLVGTAGGSISYSYRVGHYTKIGNVCHITGDIRLSGSWSGSTGSLNLNLPFASEATGGCVGAGIVSEWNLTNSNSDNIMIKVDNNESVARFTRHSGANNNTGNFDTANFGSGRYLKFAFTYQTA